MDVDKQLKCVEDFFNFTLSRIPDLDQKRDLDRPLNTVKIRKDVLIRYNKLKSILDDDLWQTFSKRSIYILQALENLVANADDDADNCDSSDDESSDDESQEDISPVIKRNIFKDKNSVKNDDVSNCKIKSSDYGIPNSKNSDVCSTSKNSRINIFNDDDVISINSDVEMSNSDDYLMDDDDDDDDDDNDDDVTVGSNNFNFLINESDSTNNAADSSDNEVAAISVGEQKQLVSFTVNKKDEKLIKVTREQLKEKLLGKILEQKAKRLKFDQENILVKNKKIKTKKNEQQNSETKSAICTTPPQEVSLFTQPAAKFNTDKTVIFSKIEFPVGKNKKSKLKGLPRGKNYDQLLGMVQKEKQKIKELKMVDKDKADILKDKILWRKLMAKAEGVKIKDNENLLRRSLNRKQFKKTKNKQQWKFREKMIDKKIQEKQNKRKENITKKVEQKKMKKIKRRQKK